jgi:hypothetical protein
LYSKIRCGKFDLEALKRFQYIFEFVCALKHTQIQKYTGNVPVLVLYLHKDETHERASTSCALQQEVKL